MDQGLSQLANNLIIEDKYIKNSILLKDSKMINIANPELFQRLYRAHLKAINRLKKKMLRDAEIKSDSAK